MLFLRQPLRRIKSVFSLVMALFITASIAQSPAAAPQSPVAAVQSPAVTDQPAGRRHINFDEDWKFHLGNAADPHRDFNYGIGNILAKTGDAANTCIKMDFDDRTGHPSSLPHDWAVALPFAQVA